MRGFLSVYLASVAVLAGCATDEDVVLEDTEQEVIVGSLAARFDDTLRGGGVVAEGASLSGRGDGAPNATAAIAIAGIPAGATVHRALLYWGISGGADTTATINAVAVAGVQVMTGGDTCWGVNNATFRADVTAQVTGNGTYTIGGLPSATSGADTNGAALVVSYQNPASGTRRRVMVRDGIITSSGSNEVVSDTFTGVAAPIASAGRFHLVVGDGQSFADGALIFNGVTLGVDQFPGSDGALWDTKSYNVTVPLGLANATWSSQTTGDCLAYNATALDWNVAVCGDGQRTGGEACENGNTTNGDGCSATCDVEPGWTCTGTPSVCTPICGDGIRTGTEQCDQGNTTNGDGCSATCTIEPGWTCIGSPSVCTTVCGDGVLAGAEQCDQGNTTNGDGCSATCTVEPGWGCTGSPSTCTTTCGDGIVAGIEACDDGDTTAGDGCDATCAVEPGWTCTGVTPSVCTTTCGDGVVAGAETCDDGGTTAGDGCSAICDVEPGWSCAGAPSTCMTACGDGIVAGTETCDDGGTTAGDGCSAACAVEPGWTCAGMPSTCTTTCGDGVMAGSEACDDGDVMAGDGCSATCTIEPGWSCTGSAPSVCTTACGDGVIAGAEACDDGNTTADDGCSAACAIEPGWTCAGQPSACDEICGDGLVVGGEACDDDGNTSGDGCSATCTVEPGWSCTGEPSTCTPNCGDGQLAGSESCDDGNTTAGDGCSSSCQTENGWSCTGTPSDCAAVCGDGLIIDAEDCDDGNTSAGDGCSATCTVEDNWSCDNSTPTECQKLTVAGGCQAGGGDYGLALVPFVLALCIGWRRRRRTGAALGAVVALGFVAVPASAQTVSGSSAFPAERFQLAMDRDGVLGTESARAPGHLAIDLGLWLGYANDPVTVRIGDDQDRLGALVHNRYGGELVGAIGLGEKFQLGVGAPIIFSQSEELGSVMTTADLAGAGLGDLSLTPKYELLRGGLDLAVAATLTLPTSGGDNFFGDDGVTFAPVIIAGHHAGAVRLLVNLGYLARPNTTMAGLDVGDELFARVGVGYRAGKADLMGEAAFATAAASPFDSYNVNSGELRAGVGYDVTASVRLFGAAATGIASGYGTPDWRALVGLWFGKRKTEPEQPRIADTDGDGLLDPSDKCVTEPETKNGFEDEDGCPDNPDVDGDGILLPADKCPTDAETKNSFEDEDGCPDTLPDSDGDGLSDPNDQCKDQPEDKDAFEDDDGCPEDDNDKDGVTDASDKCPLVVGPVENAGCPDTDRDNDTVVDRLDNCPDEPGTVKNHGCKDKQLVVFTGSAIELLQVVYFKTNKAVIEKRSHKLLLNVAAVVLAHPEITKITVEGHTDDVGDDAHNKDLSQRRAQAVADFLIANQVKADLLVPIGYGEERPIKDNTTKQGRAANRRVEFKVESAAAPAAGPPTAPAAAPSGGLEKPE